jgi:hypothetical protein
MKLTCRVRLWVPGFICPLVRGIPWILLGSLGGPLGAHGRSMEQNSAVAAAGSTFFSKISFPLSQLWVPRSICPLVRGILLLPSLFHSVQYITRFQRF